MTQEVIMSGVGTINNDRLHADIKTAVPGFAGLSTRPGVNGIVLIFEDNTSAEDIATAQGLVTAHDPNVKTAEQQARLDLLGVAQSAEGVNYNDLTTAQLKALLAALIYKEGGLANDLTIKPILGWLR